jgi:hypothetical protein
VPKGWRPPPGPSSRFASRSAPSRFRPTTLAFFVALNRDDIEIEHHPRHRPIDVEAPDAQFGANHWTA